jgi:hypothetical protein
MGVDYKSTDTAVTIVDFCYEYLQHPEEISPHHLRNRILVKMAQQVRANFTTTTILPHKWQHPSCQLRKARQRKVETIENYPRPTNGKQLKSYLSMASYYRKFTPNFSRIVAPLYALLKASVSFEWATEQELETKGEIGIKTNF